MEDDATSDAQRETPLRFRQGRFERRGMPLSAIDDLRQYQLLLEDAAKAIWRERHPNSKRVPSKVLESVALRLVDFEPGSVIPVLEREATLDLGSDFDLLDAAKARVDEAFAAMVDGRVDAYRELGLDETRLHSFGKRLVKKERVELRPHLGAPVSYSRELRRRSIERAEEADEANQARSLVNLTLVGLLRGLETDHEGGTFKLKPLIGREVTGKFNDAETFQDLRKALELIDGSSFVRLGVQARTSDRETTIESVTEVEQFDVEPSPWRARLRALLANDPDWDISTPALPPRIEDLQVIDQLLRDLPQDVAARALLGVIPEGHAFAEWSGRTWLVRVDVGEDMRLRGYRKILGAGAGERTDFASREVAAAWLGEVAGNP